MTPQATAAIYPVRGAIFLVQHLHQLGPKFLRSLLKSFLITLAILLPLSAITFTFQRRLIVTIVRVTLSPIASFILPRSIALSPSWMFLGHSLETWSAFILTTGETSLLVALVMGKVLENEKASGKRIHKIVFAHHQLQFGSLAKSSGALSSSLSFSYSKATSKIQQSLTRSGKDTHGEAKTMVSKELSIMSTEQSFIDDEEESPFPEKQLEQRQRRRDLVSAASTHMMERVVLWLLTLPLNLLPVAGQIVFCYINGKARVPDVHRTFFDMKGMTAQERNEWIKAREAQYIAFGFVAQALEMAPLFGIVFGFTNTIGAALWAVDIEREYEEHQRINKGNNKTLLKDECLSSIE